MRLPIGSVPNNSILLAIGILCAALSIYHIRKEPRRLLCGILLILALYFVTTATLSLIAPDQPQDDGSVSLGAGSEILFAVNLLFFLLSFIGGCALCVNGIGVMRREGISLAHFLPLAFGLLGITIPFLFIGALLLISISDTLVTLSRVGWEILMYVPWMLLTFLLYSIVYAVLPKKKDCDFILVLGAGLKDGKTVTPLLAGRLKRAIKYYEAGGGKATFVLSGGKGADEQVSEAQAMRAYLLEQGISAEQITCEEKSRNTSENIRFSKQLMEQMRPSYRCMLVTSNYHVLRAVILARNVGLDAQGIGSATALYYLPAAFIREYIAVIFSYRALLVAYVVLMVVS